MQTEQQDNVMPLHGAQPAPGPGHNSGNADDEPKLKTASTRTVGTTADRLRSFVARIERLEEDKKGVADDIKEVYGEAGGEGFDKKVLRKVIALRKVDPDKRAEEEELLELYMSAIDGTGGSK